MNSPYPTSPPAPLDDTQPSAPAAPPIEQYQKIYLKRPPVQPYTPRRKKRKFPWWAVGLVLALGGYFFAPLRSNVLILGSDDAPHRGELGRTDTLVLTTFMPSKGYVGMLSIPRDLWVTLPGVGEQRINAAYFFAEAEQPGSGAGAAVATVAQNFGLTLNYYALFHMQGVSKVVDTLGGVDITLETARGGLEAGKHHLDGAQVLAFVRERYSADDFSRMAQGQIVIKAALKKMAQPWNWLRLPVVAGAVLATLDTNVPVYLWPRLGAALLLAGPDGIDGRVITREMVNPFQTDAGAQVLAPNWALINPVLMEMFGE